MGQGYQGVIYTGHRQVETHELMLPEAEYACGRSAYKAIAAALRTGNYDPAGAVETLSVYAASKQMAAAYAAEAEGGIGPRWLQSCNPMRSSVSSGTT